jgi:hypothetical protein
VSLSTGAALGQWIRTLGLGLDVSNRISKIPAKRPYITIADNQPMVPGRLEDGGPGTCEETCLIDVWQSWKTQAAAGGQLEDPTIPNRLILAIHGKVPVDNLGKPILATGVGGTGVIYRVKVVSNHQVSDPSTENLVHNAITVVVWRQM